MPVRAVTLRVLGDDKDALAALARVDAAANALEAKHPTIRIGVDDSALPRLVGDMAAVDSAMRAMGGVVLRPRIDTSGLGSVAATAAAASALGGGGGNQGGGGAAAAAAAGGAAGGLFQGGGGLFGIGGRIALAGGLLGSIGIWHVLIDTIIEIGSVLIPAAIAMGAFGLAGADAAQTIYTNFNNANTAITAVGGKLPALKGGFSAVQDAVKPQVLTLFGEGLSVLSRSTSAFRTLATGAGNDLIQFVNRGVMAFQSSGGFAQKAVGDLKLVLDIVGNVSGTIGNLLHGVANVGNVLFRGLDLASLGLEHITSSGIVQGLFKVGLGLHGAVLWGGLAATAMVALHGPFTAVTNAVGKFISYGLANTLTKLAGFAATPWGWVTIGVAALTALLILTNSMKDSTVKWLDSLQQAADQASVYQMLNTYAVNQGKIALSLVGANQQLASSAQKAGSGYMAMRFGIDTALTGATAKVSELNSGLNTQTQEGNRIQTMLTAVGQKYGLNAQQVEALTIQMTGSSKAASALWSQFAHGQMSLNALLNEYRSYFLATAGMVPSTNRARAALYAMTQTASDTATAINNVNQAEDKLMSESTGLVGAQIALQQNMGQLRQAAHAVGASFTGVNANSLSLQSTFETTFIPQLQSVKDGLQTAGASTKVTSAIIATDMLPAVELGATKNKAFAAQLMQIAIEAGYNGPRNLGAFIGWIQRTGQNAKTVAGEVAALGAAIANLPSMPNYGSISRGGGAGNRGPTGGPTINSRAAGGLISEPVVGVGMNTGQIWTFGERGSEYVVPNGGGDVHIHNHYHGVAVPEDVARGIHKGLRDYKRKSLGGQPLGLD